MDEVYSCAHDTFTYHVAYKQRSIIAAILENQHLPLKDFMTEVQAYYGSGLRNWLDGDTLKNYQYAKLNELHIYGSSRLGVLNYSDTVYGGIRLYDFNLSEGDTSGGVFAVEEIDYYLYDSMYTLKRGDKHYEGSNHLGNVLVVFTDKRLAQCSSGVAYKYHADLIQAQHYSAFGAPMPGLRWYANSTDQYKFGFNGKEEDDEFSVDGSETDFGARIFNSRLGRFMRVDAFSGLYTEVGPYGYAGNNPIRYIDYNGDYKMDPFFVNRYPELAKFVAYYMPQLMNNSGVMEAWIKASGYTDIEQGKKAFQEMVTWGSGPYITFSRDEEENKTDDRTLDFYFGMTKPGLFVDKFPNNIFINSNCAYRLEQALKTGKAEEIGYAFFYFSYCVLHESTHWGSHHNGGAHNDCEREDGARFEEYFFGQRITYRSCTDLYKQGIDEVALRKYYDTYVHTARVIGMTPYWGDFSISGQRWREYQNYPMRQGQPGDTIVNANGDGQKPSQTKPKSNAPSGGRRKQSTGTRSTRSL